MDDSYRLAHRPFADGDEIWNLSATGTFPPDVYDHPEWYSFGEWTPLCAAVIRSVRGRPDGEVRIYRAAPPGVTRIDSGDWVTTHLGYARQHAMRTDDPSEDWPVLTALVRADAVRSGGSDIVEWGYFGTAVDADLVPTEAGRH